MSRTLSPRRQVRDAEQRLRGAQVNFARRSNSLRRSWQQHRAPWIVGAGVASGALAAMLPVRAWARVGALLFGTAALVLRSPVTGVLLGSMLRAQGTHSTEAPEQP